MSTTTEMDWRQKAACKARPDLFQNPALDYDPADPDFSYLPADEQAALAAGKAAAEEAARDFCFGCPVMQECDNWALTSGEAFGVAGGRTESERVALLNKSGVKVQVDTTLTANLRDRGPRLQIDDSAVERLTAQGRDATYIARELDCAERTVVRARARITARRRAAEAAQATDMTAQVEAVTAAAQAIETPVAPEDAVAIAAIDAEIAALEAAPRSIRRTRRTDNGAREISPAMQAIYSALADGQWHSREALILAGVSQISDTDAIEWWTRINSIDTAEGKVLNPVKATTPVEDRITLGARDKVGNMLSASARNAKNTERGGPNGSDRDLYRITAKGAALTQPVRSTVAA